MFSMGRFFIETKEPENDESVPWHDDSLLMESIPWHRILDEVWFPRTWPKIRYGGTFCTKSTLAHIMAIIVSNSSNNTVQLLSSTSFRAFDSLYFFIRQSRQNRTDALLCLFIKKQTKGTDDGLIHLMESVCCRTTLMFQNIHCTSSSRWCWIGI